MQEKSSLKSKLGKVLSVCSAIAISGCLISKSQKKAEADPVLTYVSSSKSMTIDPTEEKRTELDPAKGDKVLLIEKEKKTDIEDLSAEELKNRLEEITTQLHQARFFESSKGVMRLAPYGIPEITYTINGKSYFYNFLLSGKEGWLKKKAALIDFHKKASETKKADLYIETSKSFGSLGELILAPSALKDPSETNLLNLHKKQIDELFFIDGNKKYPIKDLSNKELQKWFDLVLTRNLNEIYFATSKSAPPKSINPKPILLQYSFQKKDRIISLDTTRQQEWSQIKAFIQSFHRKKRNSKSIYFESSKAPITTLEIEPVEPDEEE